ncbi:hypothetical protein ACQ4LE_008611 [Meloidogyne hapla]
MGPKMADEERIKFQLEKEDLNERNGEGEETPIVVNFEGGGGEGSEDDEEEDRDYRNISNSSIEAPSNVDCYPSALNTLVGDNEANNRHHCQFGNYTRYLVMCITTLCLSMSMANSLALNFTVICMHKEDNKPNNLTTIDSTKKVSRPMFNSAEQALLFSSVPVGTLLGTLPITPLTSRFGMRKTFVFYGLISSFATLFTPLAVKLDFGFLLIMRVLQGLAVSICFPASGSIIADWSPLRSAGTFIAFLSCHIQFGPILTMPLAGKLCESSWGWPAVYHLQAMLTALAFGAFFTFYRDSPRIHRNVSRKELCKIEKGKPPSEAGPVAKSGEIPYAAMFRDPAVWAIFFCSMGSTFGFHIFMQYGPVYLNQIIKFDVQRTGFAMALPCILSVLVKLVVGSVSDRANCLSERSRVLLFASLSQFLVAICFCTLALLPQDSPPLLVQCFFTTVPVVCGLNCAGVGKSTQLISRQFAHVVTSFSVFACSSIIILIPILVSFLAPDNRPEQWTRIFLIVAVVVVFCVLFFDCTAEASPRPWTFTKKNKKYQNTKINNK